MPSASFSGFRARQVLAGATATIGILLPAAAVAPAHAAQTPGNSSAALPHGKATYSTPGNWEFVVPPGVTRITTTITGAGGGGGAGVSPIKGGGDGGGGGGGATVHCTLNVHPGDHLNIHIAAGGTGGAGEPSDGNGENGDTSQIAVNKPIRAQANGGTGGQTGDTGGAGGIGGIAVSCGKGTHAKLHNGNPGTDGRNQQGVGGAPGKKVPSTCPTGTGQGGNGGTVVSYGYTAPGHPGGNGCIVLSGPGLTPPPPPKTAPF